VLRKADEWQRHFATEEIRLDIEGKSNANISARWRKFEVSSWPSLIGQRILRFEAGERKWFYFLYDAILRSEIFEGAVSKDLMAALDQLLRASSSGEFMLRRRLLSCFA
jgi:midasin (ATPase involved in ribosome maturation)